MSERITVFLISELSKMPPLQRVHPASPGSTMKLSHRKDSETHLVTPELQKRQTFICQSNGTGVRDTEFEIKSHRRLKVTSRHWYHHLYNKGRIKMNSEGPWQLEPPTPKTLLHVVGGACSV